MIHTVYIKAKRKICSHLSNHVYTQKHQTEGFSLTLIQLMISSQLPQRQGRACPIRAQLCSASCIATRTLSLGRKVVRRCREAVSASQRIGFVSQLLLDHTYFSVGLCSFRNIWRPRGRGQCEEDEACASHPLVWTDSTCFTWTLAEDFASLKSHLKNTRDSRRTLMLKTLRLNAESFTQDGKWGWLLLV